MGPSEKGKREAVKEWEAHNEMFQHRHALSIQYVFRIVIGCDIQTDCLLSNANNCGIAPKSTKA